MALLYSALLCWLHIMVAGASSHCVNVQAHGTEVTVGERLRMTNRSIMMNHNGFCLAAFCGLNTKNTNRFPKLNLYPQKKKQQICAARGNFKRLLTQWWLFQCILKSTFLCKNIKRTLHSHGGPITNTLFDDWLCCIIRSARWRSVNHQHLPLSWIR